MIPKGPLGRQQLSNCKIFTGSEHSHQSQKPTFIDISKLNSKNVLRKMTETNTDIQQDKSN